MLTMAHVKKIGCGLLVSAMLGCASQASATTTYFTENFQNLDAWTTKGDSSASVSAGVLSFAANNSGGDIFTKATFASGSYVDFDYKGVAEVDGGGFVGFSVGLPGDHAWLAGAYLGFPTANNLINDGEWHHYSIKLEGFDVGHVMLEQYGAPDGGSYGQFRNLSVSGDAVPAVPEPETYAILLAGLFLMGGVAKRRRFVVAE